MAKQIKSKERVAERGEVFTAEREVNAMLDLVKQETERVDSRFLEPACGTGNFLVEILRRKLDAVWHSHTAQHSRNIDHGQVDCEMVQALTSIYGIDIMQDNVEECRQRLFGIVSEWYPQAHLGGQLEGELRQTVELVLNRNILWGDALTLCEPVDKDVTEAAKHNAPAITFSEWAFIADRVKRKDYHLASLLQAQTQSVPDLFSDLGDEAYLPPAPVREFRPIHYLKLYTQDAAQ